MGSYRSLSLGTSSRNLTNDELVICATVRMTHLSEAWLLGYSSSVAGRESG